MQENRKIINGCKVNNDRKSIKRALSPYAQDGSKAVLESVWNWGLLYDMFSDCDLEVKIAHPLKGLNLPRFTGHQVKSYN
jgi:hypothetical protein